MRLLAIYATPSLLTTSSNPLPHTPHLLRPHQPHCDIPRVRSPAHSSRCPGALASTRVALGTPLVRRRRERRARRSCMLRCGAKKYQSNYALEPRRRRRIGRRTARDRTGRGTTTPSRLDPTNGLCDFEVMVVYTCAVGVGGLHGGTTSESEGER
ncbi:hypothetical protein EDB84DRAFT_169977 [Lactarius hengduanensis]|nr:hypothetical protein EDB84DRAFT_169977 [Lactarius hengduanensis]